MQKHGSQAFTDTKEGTAMNSDQLVTAQELETRGVMKRGTAYRMAEAGKLPHYVMGNSGRGIRFRVEEVLAALRRPMAVNEK
jgi:excisionase family DNA binding protein